MTRSSVSDPITLQIIHRRLSSVPELVDQNISRTAFSPLVADYKDYAVGIVDPGGRLITQARGGLPIFVANALGTAVRQAIEVHGVDNLRHGDVVISNDPAILGQHLNNIVMCTPIRLGGDGGDGLGELIGFFAVVIHLVDIGGGVIGSIAPNATDIWQEGVQYPSVKLWSRGEPVADVYRILEANSRFPREVAGDLAAQVAGCLFGRDRVLEIVQQYGPDDVAAAAALAWTQAETHVREQIRRLTPGRYRASAQLDDDGAHPGTPIDVVVELEIDDSGSATVDLSGVADQVPSAHNAGFNGGAVAAARLAIKYLFSPHEPANEGDFAPLRLLCREGTFLSARYGAALGCSGNILPTVVDAILRCFGDAGADIPAAHHGNYSYHIVGGRDPGTGKLWQSMSSMAGGWGGARGRDGAGPFRSMCHGDTLEVPVELQEALFPLRVDSLRLLPDSGGPGRHRGGPGMEKRVTVLADATLSASMDRTVCPPWGLDGGSSGVPGGGRVDDGERTVPFLRVSGLPLTAGASVVVSSSGGGGFGPPDQRDPRLVARDVREGLVSVEAARATYRVILTPSGDVDEEATAAWRGPGGHVSADAERATPRS